MMTHVETFRSTGLRHGAGKMFVFSKIFFHENDVLECAYYIFCINKFASLPQRITFFDILNFAVPKDFFEARSQWLIFRSIFFKEVFSVQYTLALYFLARSSVIKDIALPCKQLCNLNIKCYYLKVYSYFKYSQILLV